MAFLRRYLSCFFVFAALAAVAATAPDAPTREKSMPSPARTTAVSFTVFAQERLSGLCFYPDEEKAAQAQTLKFFTQSRSEVYRYRGAPEVLFYKASTLAAVPRPVARVVIPPEVTRALLVFTPLAAPTAEGIEFSVLVVDDGLARLPAGGVAVINLASRVYRGHLDGKHLKLPGGASEAVAVGGGALDFRLACEDAGKWVAAGSYSFKMGPAERVWLVLFPPTSRTGIAPIIRRLSEVPAGGG